MFNNTSHQGNANYDYAEISLYTPTEQLKYKGENTQFCQECADNGSLIHCW